MMKQRMENSQIHHLCTFDTLGVTILFDCLNWQKELFIDKMNCLLAKFDPFTVRKASPGLIYCRFPLKIIT